MMMHNGQCEQISMRGKMDLNDACSNDNLEWIGKLFPPTFELNLKRHASETFTGRDAGRRIGPVGAAIEDEAFAQATERNEPAAIQNLYCRVWTMERDKTLDDDSKVMTSRHDRVDELVEVRQVVDKLMVEPDDSVCVWDRSEMDILRKALRSIREENAALRGRLAVLESDLSKLTRSNRKHQKLVQQLTARLTDAVKANRRLHLTAENMKHELNETSKLLHQLHLDKANESRLNSEILRLEAELALRNTQLKRQEELTEAKWILLLETQRINESAAQVELRGEIAKLTKKTDDLTQSLVEERLNHQRTRMGLEQLRRHFANISDCGGEVKDNLWKLTKLELY